MVMARLRAGHARPLQTAVNGSRTRGARECGSPAPFPLTGCRGRLRAAYMPPLQRCCSPLRGFGGAWRRTTSAASLLRKHARAVVCPAGANIAHTPVSLRSTVAPVRNPATPPYDVKDKGDAKRNRALTQGCGPGMPGPYGLPQMGCRREGQGRAAAVPGQSFHSAERCPINRTQKRPKNHLVRHCGQNAHNSSENMCNFLNKTPLRKRGFLVQ